MPIKISQILASNVIVELDANPVLGGALKTNNYPIWNNGNPVTITGNKYPVIAGAAGEVMTSDGAGNIVFTTISPGSSLKLYKENPVLETSPVAQGTNSIALGDAATTGLNAPNSLAIGAQSLSRLQGSVMQANGRFASSGDAQSGRYIIRNTTINNAPTELFINGSVGNVRLVLPDDSTWTFRITVTAHRTDAGDGHAGYTASGVICRESGAITTRIQGSVQKTVLAESNAIWDINIGADTVNGSLKVSVLGEASKTIRWVALVETVEITN